MEKEKSKRFKKLCAKYGVIPDNVREILSFEAACKDRKVDPKKLPIVKHLPKKHQKRLIADYKLSIIADALRGGKDVDFNNPNQWKYWPYFRVKADAKRPSGFGLSFYDFDSCYTYSDVGVRLCFENRDTAIFFGKHFLKLHEEHHLYK